MKLGTVEALRAVAALAVTWFHLTNGYPWDAVRWSGTYGWLGVDCFFVISGFVIPYSLYINRYSLGDFPRFFLKRIVRLEPPYIASIILVLALLLGSSLAPGFRGNEPKYDIGQIAAHIFYLVPLTHYEWLNPVYWTLAYEFVFYIVIGLSFTFLWPKPIYWTVGIAAVAIAAAWLVTSEFNSRLVLFLIGIATMRHFVRRDSTKIFWSVLLFGGASMVLAADYATAVVGIITAVILAHGRVPSPPPVLWLASISYSLYLTHVPVGGRIVNLGRRFGEGVVFELGLSLFALAACIAFAWLFSLGVERAATAASKRIKLKARPIAEADGRLDRSL